MLSEERTNDVTETLQRRIRCVRYPKNQPFLLSLSLSLSALKCLPCSLDCLPCSLN